MTVNYPTCHNFSRQVGGQIGSGQGHVQTNLVGQNIIGRIGSDQPSVPLGSLPGDSLTGPAIDGEPQGDVCINWLDEVNNHQFSLPSTPLRWERSHIINSCKPVPSDRHWNALESLTLDYLTLVATGESPAEVAQKIKEIHKSITNIYKSSIPQLLAEEINDLLSGRLVYFQGMAKALRSGSRQELTYAQDGIACYSDRLASALASINPNRWSLRQTQPTVRYGHDLLENWLSAQMAGRTDQADKIRQQWSLHVQHLRDKIMKASAGIDRTIGSDSIFPAHMFF